MRNCKPGGQPGLATDILVDQVESKSGTGTLQLGDPLRDLLDGVHLLVQEVGLKEIAKMSVTVGCLVHVEKTLVDSLLQLKGSLHGLQRSAPLHAGGLGDVLEDNLASSSVLIFDELLAMVSLLVGVLLEEGGEAAVSDVISVEVVSHGHVDVAGVQLHVDLLVDQGLAVLLVVLSDAGSHDVELLLLSSCACTLSGAAVTSQSVRGIESYSCLLT